jgi:hypothetical protein
MAIPHDGSCIGARCAESAQNVAADEAAGSDHCDLHRSIVSWLIVENQNEIRRDRKCREASVN